MARKATRTEWRPIVLDMAIETSSMEIMLRGGRRQTRPVVRVIFRTSGGKAFSGPRISAELRRALVNDAAESQELLRRRGRK